MYQKNDRLGGTFRVQKYKKYRIYANKINKNHKNICIVQKNMLYLRTPPCAVGTIPPKVRSRNARHTTARSKFLKNRLCLLNQSFTYHLHMQASDVAVNN